MDTTFPLRRTNLIAAVLHGVSAIAILVLSNNFALPVTANYMQGPPGPDTKRELVTLFSIPTAALVGAFFLLSAIAHAFIAGPGWDRYQENLAQGRNPYRWVEYSLSSSLMIVAIAQIVGISDVAALVALVGVNASMIGFGWHQEKYEHPGSSLSPFWIGCLAGIIPWLGIGIYLGAPGAHAHAPGFVYGIFFSLFVFFNCFALNQYLQYRHVGKWKDYLYGEKTYLTLSLVAKSLLAWQIFGSTLASTNAGH